MPTVHIIVKGKVQGVFYRATAKDIARELGLSGWVKNKPGGDVEMKASGDKNLIDLFIDWCHKGPTGARVSQVKVNEIPPEDFEGFHIMR